MNISQHELKEISNRNYYLLSIIYQVLQIKAFLVTERWDKFNFSMNIIGIAGLAIDASSALIQNNNVDGIIADTWKSLELCIKDINEKKIPVICLLLDQVSLRLSPMKT